MFKFFFNSSKILDGWHQRRIRNNLLYLQLSYYLVVRVVHKISSFAIVFTIEIHYFVLSSAVKVFRYMANKITRVVQTQGRLTLNYIITCYLPYELTTNRCARRKRPIDNDVSITIHDSDFSTPFRIFLRIVAGLNWCIWSA